MALPVSRREAPGNRQCHNFLRTYEKPQTIYFTGMGLCLRLLKLLPHTNLYDRQQAQVLFLFRSRVGLPMDLFERDVVLQGKESSTSCPRKLLTLCFPSIAKETHLPLGKEALSCIPLFLYKKRIGKQTLPTLQELLYFLDKTPCNALQTLVLAEAVQALTASLRVGKGTTDFSLECTKDQMRAFTQCYFNVKGVETTILSSGRHSISLTHYVKLFGNSKYAKIVHSIAKEIDAIEFHDKACDFLSILPAVPIEYRMAIVSVQFFADVKECYLERLIEAFPNYRPKDIRPYKVTGDGVLSQISAKKITAAELDMIAQRNPWNMFAQELLCEQLKEGRLFVEAEECIRTVIKNNMESSFSLFTLGSVLSLMGGRDDEAIAFFERAIELNPKRVKVYRSLALLLIKQNRLDEAEQVLHRGLTIFPEDGITKQCCDIVLSRRIALLSIV
ncbi:MAG: tetratricopeptide repeat protein [Verrucomicrobia bacterium]|nr:tetratricopeptide repeat protein [Verrucomicrobiota bacterium]